MTEPIDQEPESSEPARRTRPRTRRLFALLVGLAVLVIAVIVIPQYLKARHTRQIAEQIAEGTYPFRNEIIGFDDPRYSGPEEDSLNEWGRNTAAELQELALDFHFEFDVSVIHDGGIYPDQPDRVSVRFERPDGIYGVTVIRGTHAEAWSLRTPEQHEDFRRQYDDYTEFNRLIENVMSAWMPPYSRPRAAIEMLTRQRGFQFDLREVLNTGGFFEKDYEWQGWQWTLGRDEDGERRYLRFYISDWGDHYPELNINRTRD